MDIEQINMIYTDYLNDCETEHDMEQIFDLALQALQADGDLISRSRMLAILKENYEFMTVDGYTDLFKDFIKFIKNQPSVTIPPAEANMTWVTGADGAKVAFKDVPVDKVVKICEILGEKGGE